MKSTIPTLALAAVAAVIFVLRAGLSFTQTNDVSYLTEADVRVQESDPERNYAHRGLWTGGSASDHKESYLCFRLSVVGGGRERQAAGVLLRRHRRRTGRVRDDRRLVGV